MFIQINTFFDLSKFCIRHAAKAHNILFVHMGSTWNDNEVMSSIFIIFAAKTVHNCNFLGKFMCTYQKVKMTPCSDTSQN